MASLLNVQCGPCKFDGRTNNAKLWCTNCEEGFCEECEKSHKSMKVLRQHTMISMEDYRKFEDITIKMNCEIHGKKLDLYRKEHEMAVCVTCIASEHKSCSSSDIISIEKALTRAKQMHGSKQNICNISLQLKQKFYIKGCEVPITGCIILSDYRIIFADYTGSMLMEYNNNGKHIRDILVDHRPFDLAAVDTDRIVVSYGVSKYLEIINTNKENERKKVECSDDCWGISYQDQKVCVIVDHQGIVIMDIEGKISTIIDIDVTHVLYLSTSIDRIYYTNFHNSTVHCCSMTGQELWAFKNRSMTYQRGLSVDSSQNVFVVGLMSNNLTVIRNDGVESKILLTDRDGLDCPYTVHYNKLKKIVCLGYTEGSVALYDVLEKETEHKEANAV